MRICAYNELYIHLAQRMMGDMFDYAVNTLGYNLSNFYKLFIVSGLAHQVERGNPTYVAGMNGCEVAREVVVACGLECPDNEDIMYVDKSVEYWIGWALAYYQWFSNRSFADIGKTVSIDDLYRMYPTFHEMDIEAFVESMDGKAEQAYKEAKLRRLRGYAGLSQSQLAAKADVALRQIQMFEQGKRDINKTQGETLLRLSKAIGCDVEDLL